MSRFGLTKLVLSLTKCPRTGATGVFCHILSNENLTKLVRMTSPYLLGDIGLHIYYVYDIHTLSQIAPVCLREGVADFLDKIGSGVAT